MRVLGLVLVLVLVLGGVKGNNSKEIRPATPYMSGEEVKIECKTREGEWGPGPICVDSDSPLSFKVLFFVVVCCCDCCCDYYCCDYYCCYCFR